GPPGRPAGRPARPPPPRGSRPRRTVACCRRRSSRPRRPARVMPRPGARRAAIAGAADGGARARITGDAFHASRFTLHTPRSTFHVPRPPPAPGSPGQTLVVALERGIVVAGGDVAGGPPTLVLQLAHRRARPVRLRVRRA